MSNSSLYDDDILLWSEQQAAVIRELGRTRRDLPNELDVQNVAEEVESVGRSELAAVKSYIRNVFIHLIKLIVEPDADAARHWRGDIFVFHSDMRSRYAPSMRQRIDLDDIWQEAQDRSLLFYEGPQHELVSQFPSSCPVSLDELVVERLDSFRLVERLRQTGISNRTSATER